MLASSSHKNTTTTSKSQYSNLRERAIKGTKFTGIEFKILV